MKEQQRFDIPYLYYCNFFALQLLFNNLVNGETFHIPKFLQWLWRAHCVVVLVFCLDLTGLGLNVVMREVEQKVRVVEVVVIATSIEILTLSCTA